MSGDKDKIYADASQPATLIDGDNSIDCPTLGEAVIALDHLPADRQIAARIKVGDRVFTAAEIDRLHHRKAASKDWLGRFKAPLRRLIKDPSIGLNRWEEADRHISDYLRPFKAADWQGAARQWLAGSMMRHQGAPGRERVVEWAEASPICLTAALAREAYCSRLGGDICPRALHAHFSVVEV